MDRWEAVGCIVCWERVDNETVVPWFFAVGHYKDGTLISVLALKS